MKAWEKTKDPRIKKRDGVYWARFTKKGKRVETTLETRNFEVAAHLVADIEARVLAGKSWKRERQLFSDAWIEFLADKQAGNKVKVIREKTLLEYIAFGERYYKPFFGNTRVGEIEDEWEGFIRYVQAKSPGVKFFNITKYMQGFFTWALAHGKVTAKPYLRNPDALAEKAEEFSPGKAYTREELKRIRSASKRHGRFHLFVLMMQYMGMRPSEITQLKKDRIDLEKGIITLKKVDTKTWQGRMIPIHQRVKDALIERLIAEPKHDYLFPHAHRHLKPNAPMDRGGFKKVWEAIAQEARVDGRIYDFRHTFITHAIEQGLNPSAVAKMTGTSIRVIEKHYLHLGPEMLGKELKSFDL